MQGFLSSPYTATYYRLAQRHPDVPRMTEKQYEALRLYNALALSDKLRLDLMLQPGDIQLLSNHTQLHTRSAFVDYPVSCTPWDGDLKHDLLALFDDAPALPTCRNIDHVQHLHAAC